MNESINRSVIKHANNQTMITYIKRKHFSVMIIFHVKAFINNKL
jgi:hypothetical protein